RPPVQALRHADEARLDGVERPRASRERQGRSYHRHQPTPERLVPEQSLGRILRRLPYAAEQGVDGRARGIQAGLGKRPWVRTLEPCGDGCTEFLGQPSYVTVAAELAQQ